MLFLLLTLLRNLLYLAQSVLFPVFSTFLFNLSLLSEFGRISESYQGLSALRTGLVLLGMHNLKIL